MHAATVTPRRWRGPTRYDCYGWVQFVSPLDEQTLKLGMLDAEPSDGLDSMLTSEADDIELTELALPLLPALPPPPLPPLDPLARATLNVVNAGAA